MSIINDLITEALASDLGKTLTEAGFGIQQTGGGCLAWEKKTTDGHYAWITDEDGASLGDSTDQPFLVGFYTPDGDNLEEDQGAVEGIAAAIAWCEARLAFHA